MRQRQRIYQLAVWILLLLSVFLTAGLGFTQTRTGTIRGIVKDEGGEPLPGVTVEVRAEALMGKRTMTTDAQGGFRFPALPIGKDYELTFTLQGFQTLTRPNLQISIGATLILDITLTPATLEKQIIVTAESPLVDVNKSSFSSTYDAKTLESIPNRRYTFFDMVQASPGITPSSLESSRVSAFGSGSEDNAYYMNGINNSAPSTGASWCWPTPDAIAEIEVTGVGAPAEYGNYTGAVINIVSKSGSNTFHGAAKYFLQTNSLTGNNTPNEKWPYHRKSWHDGILSLSGPVVKDKLWFYASFQHNIGEETGVGANPAYAATYRMAPIFNVKVDYQLNRKNKLSLFVDYEDYRWDDTPTEFAPFSTISFEASLSAAPTLEWLCMLTDKTYFELKYAGFYTYLKYDPSAGNMTTPGRLDWGTGVRSVNATGFYHWKTNRTGFNASISHYAQDFLKGNHDFKAGVQYNHGYSDFIWGYIGGVEYYDWLGYPYAAYVRTPSHYGGVIDQIGVFVDDSWTVTNRLTVNLGLRFDHNHGAIPDFQELDRFEKPTGKIIPGIPNVANWKTLSPRLGINYQLTPNRKTILRASYGRYYSSLIIGDFENATPAQGTLYVYGYNWNTGTYSDLWRTWNPLTDLGLDPNLKAEYADQFSLALEREIFTDFSLSATFIYKQQKNIIARTNTAAQYEQIPYYDAISGKTIMVYNQVTPLQDFYLVTNPGNEITYRGLMLVANKRFSNNFQFYSSLTLSRAWFNPKGFTDKNSLVNAVGPTDRDRRWMFKIGGSYMAPLGIVLGTNIIYEQESAWQRTARVSLNQGLKSIFAEPRGSRRFPDHLYIDLKIEKKFRIASRYTITFSCDIFNLLNKDTNLSWVSTLGDSPNWMVPTSIILPRRAMVGARFEF